MKNYIGEFKGMSKDEIIDTYDDMVERLLGRVNEIQEEVDKLKKGTGRKKRPGIAASK